jgi:hypothetical protein
MSPMEKTDVSTVIVIIHPTYRSAFLLCVYAKMLNFVLMLLHPLLNDLPLTHTLSLFLSLRSFPSIPFCI